MEDSNLARNWYTHKNENLKLTLYPISAILKPVYMSSECSIGATPPNGPTAARRYTAQEPTQTAALKRSRLT